MARADHVHRAFQTAAEAVRRRIRADQERVASDESREMLRTIEREIFTPGFEVGSLNASPAARAEFAAVFDATPQVYYRVRLIEAVLYMLDHTDADLVEIAPHVGYEYPQSLARAFKKMMGHTPKEERRLWREELDPRRDEPPPPPIELPKGWNLLHGPPEDFRIDGAPELRRAVVGGLELREAGVLLLNLYIQLPQKEGPALAGRAVALWLDVLPRSVSKGGAEALRPEARERGTGALRPGQETAYLEQARDATFAVQDRFAPAWEEGPGKEGVADAVARLRGVVFEQGSSLEAMKAEYQLTAAELGRLRPSLGLSPAQYLVETRMEYAARLLCDTPLTVFDVSWHVGYGDARQFRRAFRKWSGGLTPDGFRRRAREAARRGSEPPPDWMHWRVLEVARRPVENLEETRRLLRHLHAVYGVPGES